MKIRTWLAAFAVAGMASYSFGQITGKVTLDGDKPESKQIDMSGVPACAAKHPDPVQEETYVLGDNKELANVVVSIKPEEGKTLSGDKPKDAAVLDQKGCQYHPHVVAMRVGQDLIISNSDPFLHNVHSLAQVNPAFNKGQPDIDNKPGMKVEPMKAPERFNVKCDVHPWMQAHFSVFDHPFYAVTKNDGTFEIPTKGLENGTYTLIFWHEALGEQEQADVEVKDGKATVDFKFPAAAAQANPVPEIEVTLASADSGEKACCNTRAAPAVAHASAEPAAGAKAE